jgi:hypothetical protein
MLYSGARRYAVRRGWPAPFALLPLLAVFCSQYVLTYARIREQSVLPPALTMAACGWFILYCMELFRLNGDGDNGDGDGGGASGSAFAFAFCAAFLGSMYTPGLAASALCAYALVYAHLALLRKRAPARPALAVSMLLYIIVTASFTVLTLTRTNSQLDMGDVNTGHLLRSLGDALGEGPTGLFRYLAPAYAAYAALSALGVFSAFDLAVSVWAVLSLCASFLMNGYFPGAAISVQRAMVVVPVISTAAARRFVGITGARRAPTVAVGAFMAFTIALNLLYPRPLPLIINEKSSKTLTYVSERLQETLRAPEYQGRSPALVFIPDNSWDTQIHNYTRYMVPQLSTIIILDPGDELPALPPDSDGLIICATGPTPPPPSLTAQYGPPHTETLRLGGHEITVSWVLAPL